MKFIDRVTSRIGVKTLSESLKGIVTARKETGVANQEKQGLTQSNKDDTSTTSTFKSPLVSNSLSDYREQ